MEPCVAAVNALEMRFGETRALTEAICRPLAVEDYVIQALPDGEPDASPPKWHLAHTTWFFETFILSALPNYVPYNREFTWLFNSYYNSVGPQWMRANRGTLSRPTVDEVYLYRHAVTLAVRSRFAEIASRKNAEGKPLIELLELGIHHEQQHQELLIMDIKAILGLNPLFPAYKKEAPSYGPAPESEERRCPATSYNPGGLCEVGYASGAFAFDNEMPAHRIHLEPFFFEHGFVTCGDYLQFMDAGGYGRSELWLDDGWKMRERKRWRAPLFWYDIDGEWHVYTLYGLRRVNPDEPVCHVSLYEADAFARWRGKRLPTEYEFEIASRGLTTSRLSLADGFLHPPPPWVVSTRDNIENFLWRWTGSQYRPYPGYTQPQGAVGEYNGKFMCNQFVLRGGCSITPPGHYRSTYRNFFQPEKRWPFNGISLAYDAKQ